MCGRFSLSATPDDLMELFLLAEAPEFRPRYNITPSQPVATVRVKEGGAGRMFTPLRWGLIPHWAKEASIGAKMINARAETAAEKPSFRTAFRRRRCLIAADGYYEWKKEGERKQPYHIRFDHGGPFAFAGLWERWEGPEGPLETCAILTTACNELLRPVHHRMPVILQPEDFEPWLDPELQERERLQPLLRPHSGKGMTFYPVSTHVNRPANDDAQCVTPLEG